ncbi:tumor necrosis factor ligand superfamily member 15-like [Scyliorhinus torazame]
MDAMREEDTVGMMGQAGRPRGAPGRRTRLLLAGCVSCCFLLAGLSVYLLLQHVPAQKSETQIGPEMIRLPVDTAEKPRAHLTAKVTSSDKKDGEYFALQWEHKNGLAFTKGELNYQDRALTIPRKGDYFVYSQVSFRGYASDMNENNSLIIHMITKLTPRYPKPMQLLSSTRSINGEKSLWRMAIYLGAVFHLEQGDRIIVNVSSVKQVDFTNDHKTYFGAFLL